MERYFVQVNGMWVKNSWSNVGTVMLTAERERVEETIPQSEIDWLKTQFSDVKVFELELKEIK